MGVKYGEKGLIPVNYTMEVKEELSKAYLKNEIVDATYSAKKSITQFN